VAEVPSSDAIGDPALAAAIESQLRQAGLAVHVTVSNGEVKIERAP
jgi:hypothetical protein